MIANKYRLIENIGKGEFGYICKAVNIRTGEFVAMKQEPINRELKLLKNETKIYQHMANERGFPKVLWFGVHNDSYYMALQLLGNSLRNSGPFSLDQILLLGQQMIKRLESLHNKGFIHRDIKPDNFLFGLGQNSNILYLIDFGFCKRYQLDDGSHIPFRENRSVIGTPNFISNNIKNGCEPSRRDDLESVGNIMAYLWTNCNDRAKCNRNDQEKCNEELPIFREFITYCRTLKFDEDPKYDFFENISRQVKSPHIL